MNILELKDRSRTAWYRSEGLSNISKAAELLNQAINAKSNPDISTIEEVGGNDLHPLSHQEYEEALRTLVDGSDHGLVAEIDLVDDSGCFTQIGRAKSGAISIYTAVSRLAGLYQMSVIQETGKLDAWGLTERIMEHCDWVTHDTPREHFEKQMQELAAVQDGQPQEVRSLTITDFLGGSVTLRPRVELYSVTDFMGREMPGLALELYQIDEESGDMEPYACLTTSFGEFIGIKDSAYIDTNNCPFAEQLLEQNIAEPAGLSRRSGFCQYPLWVFKEEFLREVGGENYQIYSKAFDQYMNPSDGLEPEEGLTGQTATEEQAGSSGPVMAGM